MPKRSEQRTYLVIINTAIQSMSVSTVRGEFVEYIQVLNVMLLFLYDGTSPVSEYQGAIVMIMRIEN